jgi:hypothetical protein
MYESLLVDVSMAVNRRREEYGEFVKEAVSAIHQTLTHYNYQKPL